MFLFSAIMLSRLIFLFRDRPLNLSRTGGIIIIQTAALLLFEFNLIIAVSIAVLALLNYALYALEQTKVSRNFLRSMGLIIFFLISIILGSLDIKQYGIVQTLPGLILDSFLPGLNGNLNSYKIWIFTAGILFLLNEANFLIRYLFELFNVYPGSNTVPGDENMKTYYAGRVIGMLERVLVFFFIIIGEFSAIGFVIAAKGFTRFKELDKRDFAEYVLIGTLLSALIAICVSLLIKILVKLPV